MLAADGAFGGEQGEAVGELADGLISARRWVSTGLYSMRQVKDLSELGRRTPQSLLYLW